MNELYREGPRVPYRARKGLIFGVCKGLADYFNVDVFWVRFAAVLAFFFTAWFPAVVTYIIAALLMKPEPLMPLEDMTDAEFYSTFTSSRSLALYRLKRTYDNLERRIRRMEDVVTNKEFDWNRRFESGPESDV